MVMSIVHGTVKMSIPHDVEEFLIVVGWKTRVRRRMVKKYMVVEECCVILAVEKVRVGCSFHKASYKH